MENTIKKLRRVSWIIVFLTVILIVILSFLIITSL